MRVLFAGTPEFACPTLQALIDSEHDVLAVYTQPDRPAGRGKKLQASPVKTLALEHALMVLQPDTLRDEQQQNRLREFNADVMVVVAYGMLIPEAVLDMFPYGCINVHPSALPRWRGAAPIRRAIMAGDTETAVCVMQLDQGWDTGPVLWRKDHAIDNTVTAGELSAELFQLGAHGVLEVLTELASVSATVQSEQGVTHAAKLTKDDALLDWNQSAKQLHDQIRALNPAPVARVMYQDQPLKIWRSECVSQQTDAAPGTIVARTKTSLDVATGDGVLRILEVQPAGKRRMPVADFLNSQAQLVAGVLL